MKFKFAAALLALSLGWAHGATDGTLKQILNNGSSGTRLNIVILGDGYTAAESAKFDTDAQTMLNFLLADQFYKEYAPYFNGYTIFVASNESGTDHPSDGIMKDTYFNATFDFMGISRLLALPGPGESKVNALLQSLMPEYDISIMLVNDTTYGGSGGSIAVTSVDPTAQDIVVHELGHSFANLDDEYDDLTPGYPDIERANSTRETDRTKIKWKKFIASTTPVPTPETEAYAEVVGLFEGAHYQPTGWYRPQLDCKMYHLNVSFCKVCVEASVKSIYAKVSPIADYAPKPNTFSLDGSASQILSVTSLAPATHALTVQWSIDGVVVSGAASNTFTASAPQIGNGTHTVTATVKDATAMVLDDPTNLLQATQNWTATVTHAVPFIYSANALSIDQGAAFSYKILATGAPTSYTATGLPEGLTLNAANGVISGTTFQVGTFNVVLGAVNADGNGTLALALTVKMVPVLITSSLRVDATVNQPFTYTIAATSVQPATFTSSNKPSALALNASTGVLAGTFTQAGAVSVLIKAENSSGSDTRTLIILVAKAVGTSNTPPEFASNPQANPNPATEGESVQFVAQATDADGDLLAITWDFGEGSSGNGATTAHTFVGAGVYFVTATVLDGTTRVESIFPVVVNASGTSATGFGVTKLALKLNFVIANKDSLQVSGTLPVALGFTPAGKTLSFTVGELERAVQLDGKGASADKTFKLAGKLKKGVFTTAGGTLTITLKSQNLALELDSFGFVNGDFTNSERTLPVSVSFGGTNYLTQVLTLYTGKSDKSGSAKKKP